MTETAFDRDDILTDFLTGYLDQTIGLPECRAFEEYLSQHPVEQEFTRKASEGKKALANFARNIRAREGFEARLALQLHLDRRSNLKRAKKVRMG